MAKKQLNEFFITELYKVCLRQSDVFELARAHVEYHFLPSEDHKLIWRSMVNHYEVTGRLISIGILGQQYEADKDVMKVIGDIANSDEPNIEDLLEQLEIFIKQMIFISAHKELAELYNKNDDDGAFQLMTEVAEKLSNFKIKDETYYHNIIEGMEDRMDDRKDEFTSVDPSKFRARKIPTGIVLGCDDQLKGGVDRKDTLMLMGPSGSGKSKMLKFMGYYNSKLGHRIVHIQAEGSREEAEQCYDAAYAGISIAVAETGMLDEDTTEELSAALKDIQRKGGEIHLKAFETFDEGSLLDVRNYMREIVDLYGPIDALVLDYLELLHPGDGKTYGTSNDQERKRREKLGQGFKNLCMEFDCAGFTATQSSTVSHDDQNDPTFVYRREHISEFKGMIKPFSYFITINGTEAEKDENRRRLHWDKFRKYNAPVPTFPIATNMENERFYDHLRTVKIRQYGSEEEMD
tara:strand:- start:61268 stop:62656 length:1389 start_codon:yes stop_codon:yes gene_type:complete